MSYINSNLSIRTSDPSLTDWRYCSANLAFLIGKVLQTLLLIFIMGAHVNIFSIMMNTLTNHGTCTVVFMAIGAVVSFVVSMPRSYKSNSAVSMACKSSASRGLRISLTESQPAAPSQLQP